MKGRKRMVKHKKSKEERRRDRKIVEKYHQVTEDELEPLFQNFLDWKARIYLTTGTGKSCNKLIESNEARSS